MAFYSTATTNVAAKSVTKENKFRKHLKYTYLPTIYCKTIFNNFLTCYDYM